LPSWFRQGEDKGLPSKIWGGGERPFRLLSTAGEQARSPARRTRAVSRAVGRRGVALPVRPRSPPARSASTVRGVAVRRQVVHLAERQTAGAGGGERAPCSHCVRWPAGAGSTRVTASTSPFRGVQPRGSGTGASPTGSSAWWRFVCRRSVSAVFVIWGDWMPPSRQSSQRMRGRPSARTWVGLAGPHVGRVSPPGAAGRSAGGGGEQGRRLQAQTAERFIVKVCGREEKGGDS